MNITFEQERISMFKMPKKAMDFFCILVISRLARGFIDSKVKEGPGSCTQRSRLVPLLPYYQCNTACKAALASSEVSSSKSVRGS
jgi:hypothetical protein